MTPEEHAYEMGKLAERRAAATGAAREVIDAHIALHALCRNHELDADWPDNLHLADVVERVSRALAAKSEWLVTPEGIEE